MAKIIWTEEAVRWMKDILDYISTENPAAGQRVILGIYDRIQILQEFPEVGYVYKHEIDGIIRILLYGHYRIAYFIKSESTVEILGVFHGAMDINKLIH
jgi:plasmid stabilization system protein ParE